MKDRDSLDHRILSELFKNSRMSDRRLAKILGVSQPTVTRRRARLEKGLIDGYTIVPRWKEMGFEIAAFTFIKWRREHLKQGKFEEITEKAKRWLAKQPNVVLAGPGEGTGWDGVMISFHKSYSDFVKFKTEHDMELSDIILESRSFIMEVDPKIAIKPFHLKYLADVK